MKAWRSKIFLAILLLIPTFSIQADPCDESMAASDGGDTRGIVFARPESLITTVSKTFRIPGPDILKMLSNVYLKQASQTAIPSPGPCPPDSGGGN